MICQYNIIFAKNLTKDLFEYYKEIKSEGEGLKAIEIDTEIYGFTKKFTEDMRIFDSDGLEVPYHKYSNFSVDEVEKIFDFNIINLSDDEEIISATFVKDDSLDIYNKITLDIWEDNFLLYPKLYGSQDGIYFSPISSKGYIYSFNDDNRGINNTILFGEVDYKYLKVDFEKVMGNLSSKDIARAKYTMHLPYIPVQKQIKSEIISLSNEDKITEIVVDLKYNNLPLSKILIGTNNENYYRKVQILTSDNNKDYRHLTEGKISLFNIEQYKVEQNELIINDISSRYIKIKIYNQDNAALNISEIEAYYQPERIIFEGKANKSYRLYYGSKACDAPIYDISYFADKINEKAIPKSELGEMIKNPDYKKADIPFTERNNRIITLSIVLIVAVLGFMVVKNLKDK
jgi:hypothetical protein